MSSESFHWSCKHTWLRSAKNTSWCLLGCSIGDFGTIAYFQFMEISWPVWLIMCLAIFNGLITSIILETIILSKQMFLNLAFKTAIGMSLISIWLSNRFVGNKTRRFETISGKGFRSREIALGAWRWPIFAAVTLFAFVVGVLPLILLGVQ